MVSNPLALLEVYMLVEDTGEEPKCLICGSLEECEHLVASIDHTFSEIYGSALEDRDSDFRSEIEGVFLKQLKTGTKMQWQNADIEQMWQQACEDYTAETEDLMLDGYAFYRFLAELLVGAGADKHPGSVIDPGGPGMTSSVSLLYAENPSAVVDKALKTLQAMLSE